MEVKDLRVGLEIHQLDLLFSRKLKADTKAAGIDEVTMMHGWIIRYLYEHQKKDVYQRDLEQHFSIRRSTVTGIIQLMEKKGYICRESVKQDARLKRVRLTPKGISTHEEIEEMIARMESHILRGIKEEDMNIFYKVLRQIRENVAEEETYDSDDIR